MDHLQSQAGRILDETKHKRISLIVQIRSDDDAMKRMIEAAAEIHRRRTVIVSPRDLLRLSDTAAETRAALPASKTRTRLKQFNHALAKLRTNQVIEKSISRSLSDRSVGGWSFDRRDLPEFTSSGTTVLELDRDSLHRLSKEADWAQIQDIFLNRIVRLPSLVDVKDVPQALQDEKAASWGVNKINALSAWGAYGVRGKGVKVAILDTGVDATHPDLKGKVKGWAEFDSSGYEVPGSKPHDSDRHGTHCAGTVAGSNTSGAWIGVAPGADIFAGLVLPKGVGTYAQVLAGIDWAIKSKVDVISLSLGALTLDVEAPDPYTRALLSANAAGIPVVTAIGNEGSETTGTPGNDLFAFAVGATDYWDRAAGFSGGRTHVVHQSRYLPSKDLPLIYSKPEVSAPGVAIRSSVPGGKWATFNGTSMAAPHVAGAFALLLSATSIKKTVKERQRAFLLQDLLSASVQELGEAGKDHRYGFGRIDALRAIGFAKAKGF